MKIFVPGNLLLLGEYAVTLPDGLGVAMAIEPCITIEIRPSDTLKISGTYQGTTYSWKQGTPLKHLQLIDLTLKEIPIDHVEIHIDSSAFSYPDGRKKGFGSSAAVVVGLTYALLYQALSREPDKEKEVLPLALKIHRSFQGGKGSGYDVLTSLMGGAGLFKGGTLPTWKPLDPRWSNDLYLVKGDKEESTQKAIQHFESFCTSNRTVAKKFHHLSNRIVRKFAFAETTQKLMHSFHRASSLNRWINKQLNIALGQFGNHGCPGKAIGAGGEIAAVLSPESKDLEPIIISHQGVRCNP